MSQLHHRHLAAAALAALAGSSACTADAPTFHLHAAGFGMMNDPDGPFYDAVHRSITCSSASTPRPVWGQVPTKAGSDTGSTW